MLQRVDEPTLSRDIGLASQPAVAMPYLIRKVKKFPDFRGMDEDHLLKDMACL
jgi:hypothetical protein